MMKPLKILHLVPSVSPYTSFGLGAVAVNLAKHQGALGHHAEVWCVDSESGIEAACSEYKIPQQYIRSFKPFGPRRFAFSPEMEFVLEKNEHLSFDVLHQHGIWTLQSRVSNIWSEKYRNKVKLIAPHGALQKVALKKSAFKKKIACFFYENKNFLSSTCFHATSSSEVNDFREFGLKNKIALVPNGVSVEENAPSVINDFREKFTITRDKRLILYLSRITPKKGIPMLLQALATLVDKFGDWHLIIAGTDEENHLQEVKHLVSQLDLGRYVTFLGPLFGQDKRNAFKESDLFILPSYSEGSPVVILEALASGLPVITTKASPWEDLISCKCGWWCDISTVGITTALQEAISFSKDQLAAFGKNGRNLVRNRYSWHSAAEKTIELYASLLEDFK